MNKLETRWRRLKYKMQHDFLSVENVVLVLAIFLCLMWTYQSILAMSRNWALTERLVTEKKSLELAKIEVEAAELENQYYETAEYQELMVRRYLDKQLPGEKMVIMPENSNEAKARYTATVAAQVKEREYSNFDKWMMYLFPSF